MNWTSDKPSKPGWYWYRATGKNNPFIERVVMDKRHGRTCMVLEDGPEGLEEVALYDGEWFGRWNLHDELEERTADNARILLVQGRRTGRTISGGRGHALHRCGTDAHRSNVRGLVSPLARCLSTE